MDFLASRVPHLAGLLTSNAVKQSEEAEGQEREMNQGGGVGHSVLV